MSSICPAGVLGCMLCYIVEGTPCVVALCFQCVLLSKLRKARLYAFNTSHEVPIGYWELFVSCFMCPAGVLECM